MMKNESILAEKLLQIKALKINLEQPYTWASGWKSPIYCDNRKVLSFPYVRDYVKSELANMVLEHFGDAEVIAGVATAGIPHGALVADLIKLPFIYVRDKPKGHGLENRIEGVLEKGQKVVVIEDLVSTGMSSLKAVEAIREAGGEVIGMCALFTYGFPQAEEALETAEVVLESITTYDAMLEVALKLSLVNEEQVKELQEWRKAPEIWRQA